MVSKFTYTSILSIDSKKIVFYEDEKLFQKNHAITNIILIIAKYLYTKITHGQLSINYVNMNFSIYRKISIRYNLKNTTILLNKSTLFKLSQIYPSFPWKIKEKNNISYKKIYE